MKAQWLTCGRLLPCGHGAEPRFASTPQWTDDAGLISLPLERRHLQAQQRCKIFLPSVEAMMKSPVFSPRVPPPSLHVTYCRHALWATQLRRVRFDRTARPDSLAGGFHIIFTELSNLPFQWDALHIFLPDPMPFSTSCRQDVNSQTAGNRVLTTPTFSMSYIWFVYMWFHLTEDDCQARSSDSLGDDVCRKFSAIILSVTLGLWKSSGAIRSSIYTFHRSMTHCPDSDAGADSFPTQIPQYSIV